MLFVGFSHPSWAQETADDCGIIKQKHEDTTHYEVESLRSFLRGHLGGHLRSHFMFTQNEGSLSDYWTNAAGGSIHYRTKVWRGWQFGVKGIFSHGLVSNDLNRLDENVGKGAKWEIELYDILRPEERHDLDRLEELFIRHNWRESYAILGKIDINQGPLFLRRDGRMKAFVYEGFWSEINELKHQKLTLGWLYGVSPRGMTEWFSINEAIGLISRGRNPDGTTPDYHGSWRSRGIGVLGYENRHPKGVRFQLWDFYMDQISNTIWAQMDIEHRDWFGGVQYVRQDPHRRQLSLSYDERYVQSNEHTNVVAFNIGRELGQGIKISGAYLHAFDTGRFLFPRELGRENFYVSQPRSWVDGFGDTDVYDLRLRYQAENSGLTADTRLAWIRPASDESKFNKYGIQPYYQSTSTIRYRFDGKLDGLEIMMLYVVRLAATDAELTAHEKYYRNNFHHGNLVLNITF